MERTNKFFKWIKRNRKWLFSGIAITIISLPITLYTILKDEINKNGTIETGLEVNGDVHGDIYQNSTINNYPEEDNNKQEIIMSESKYLEYLRNLTNEDIIFNHYGDYDGDGSCEMFALVGEKTTEIMYNVKDLKGKIWYINEDGAMEVESKGMAYWTSPKIFTVGGNVFIAFEKAYVTGSQTFIWGVRAGKPYQPNISGKIHGLVSVNEYDEMEVTHSTYDASHYKGMDGGIGHTWKKYFFYFNGSTFKEYGGIEITVDYILRIPRGKKVIDEVYKHSYDIDSIYYRDNGIININISKNEKGNIDYYNVTLRNIDGKWDIVSPNEYGEDYGSGYYLKALIPSVATYPSTTDIK